MSVRTQRVNELLRADISEIISRELRDPRFETMISITSVESTQDMRHAKVFVSVLGTDDQRKDVMRALKSAKPVIQRLLRQRLPDLRLIPELDFRSDTSIERGIQLSHMLDDLARERGEGL